MPGEQVTARACGFITAEIDRLSSVVTSLLALARPPQLQPRSVAVADVLLADMHVGLLAVSTSPAAVR